MLRCQIIWVGYLPRWQRWHWKCRSGKWRQWRTTRLLTPGLRRTRLKHDVTRSHSCVGSTHVSSAHCRFIEYRVVRRWCAIAREHVFVHVHDRQQCKHCSQLWLLRSVQQQFQLYLIVPLLRSTHADMRELDYSTEMFTLWRAAVMCHCRADSDSA